MAAVIFNMATSSRNRFNGFNLSIMALIVLISIRVPYFCEAMDVYFPMSAVKLKLPINEKSQSIFSKIPIGQFQVLTIKNNSIAENYSYSLEQNDVLTINATTGEVFMRDDYNQAAKNRKLIITGISKNGFGELSTYVPHVRIDIFPITEEAYCKDLINICFWHEAAYVIAEDLSSVTAEAQQFHPIKIGTINARGTRYLCDTIEPKYKLETGNDNFKLQNGFIYTKRSLDHESLNFTNKNMLTGLVSCTLQTSSNIEFKYKKLFNITLIDLNDNGPELQSNQTFNFYLEQPHFKLNEPIGSKIIFVDKDSMLANAHQTYKIVNDTLDMMKTQCNIYESDHTGRRSTIISCQLIFARNGILSESPYCFVLEASDKILENSTEVFKSAHAHVCLHSNVEQIHESDRPLALALRTRQQRKFKNVVNSEEYLIQSNSQSERLILSPAVMNFPQDAYVYRLASAFHRIAQPTDFAEYMGKPRLRFNIPDERTGAFGITQTSGIVYVKDTGALQHAPKNIYDLNITWHDDTLYYHSIKLHLLPERPDNFSCEFKVKSRSQTCAQVKFKRQCETFCGLGTNGGGCTWRGSDVGSFGRNYASCVPNPQFCPDHICDPLEELNNFICPQDCTSSNKIMGPHSVNDNKRGILAASGTCTCEDIGKCSCAPIDDDEPKWKRKRKNETKSVPSTPSLLNANQDDKIGNVLNLNSTRAEERTLNVAGFVCGKSCMIIAGTCPLVFIALIICLIFSRRNLKQRTTGKNGTHKGVTQTSSGDGFGECDIRNGDLPLMQLESAFKFDPSDDKWEFERSKLKLDAVLGEGEFGKVIKGYATDICGIKGVTTVAVKMLKNGANSVEYMSLLSEFQLLQEVSHPNVIKLLGACTKEGPPMIIIEYARYGSLRSYLRLSRKIECSGVDFTDGVEPVTVKQILSFAWQICRGMAYLTEIKLVHRDLAARNVLLADGKVCKVSDFGLTRDVYEDDAYLKRSRDRVPVKWMAPESLADHVYTTKSDVWAFGVLCWELITLGASPYPGVPPQNLYHLLKSGYRMERPENCSEDVYNVIRSCWTDEPNARPSFKYLTSQFEKLLGNNAKYIEIETNAVSNPLYCSEVGSKSIDDNQSHNDLTLKLNNDLGEPDNLDHLWRPPSMSYDTQEATTNNSREFSSTLSAEFLPPPGYDLPRPLIETATTEQVLRYENDLRFPLNVRKSIYSNDMNNAVDIGGYGAGGVPHYSVPVKRGRSYVDMTKKNLIPDNLDSSDFEKHLSKTISFRFSSSTNLQEALESELVAEA